MKTIMIVLHSNAERSLILTTAYHDSTEVIVTAGIMIPHNEPLNSCISSIFPIFLFDKQKDGKDGEN
jgi:hypothetical protein